MDGSKSARQRAAPLPLSVLRMGQVRLQCRVGMCRTSHCPAWRDLDKQGRTACETSLSAALITVGQLNFVMVT